VERNQKLAEGWIEEGVVGVECYAFDRPDFGRQPLYRAFSVGTNKHLYTTSKVEYDALPVGWTREGVIGYIETETKPLYRCKDAINHTLLTTGEAERDLVVHTLGFDTDGPCGQVYRLSNQVSGLVPLYRAYNGLADHLFTTDIAERNAMLAQGGYDEGIAGYVFSQSGTGRRPVYRAWHSTIQTHLYTTTQAEYNALTSPWIKEGIRFYVAFETTPTNLVAVSTGSGKITLYWDRIPEAIGYNIYWGTTAGGENYSVPVNGGTPVNTPSYTGSDMCRYTNTGLTNGVRYFYTVKAVYSWGESAPSNEDCEYPDPSGIPWTSTTATTVTNAIRAAYSNSGVTIPSPLRAMGPDGQIYDESNNWGSNTVQPPEATAVPGTNMARLSDGTKVAAFTEPRSGTVQTQSLASQMDGGPFRRVRSKTGFVGSVGQVYVPAANAWRRVLPRERAYIYLGSVRLDGTGELDAGVYLDLVEGQNGNPDQIRGWRLFINNKMDSQAARFRMSLGSTWFAPGQDLWMRYLAFPPGLPAVRGKYPCLLRVQNLSGTQIRALSAFTIYQCDDPLLMKRVHSIAQVGVGPSGWIASGAYILGGLWRFGALIDPLGQELPWDASRTNTRPSDKMEFPDTPDYVVEFDTVTPDSHESVQIRTTAPPP
jgi:hypothetical protein